MRKIEAVDASEESRCLMLFSCFGLIDMRTQAEDFSALRSDTPEKTPSVDVTNAGPSPDDG
jgi:hypothetical protein